MGKLSREKRFAQIEKSFRYRWEFVRRNVEYQKDYKAWESFEKPSWETPKSPFMDIFIKYEIPPLNYELNYDKLTEEVWRVSRQTKSDWAQLINKEKERYIAHNWVLSSGSSLMVCLGDNAIYSSFPEDFANTKLANTETRITLTIDLRYPLEMILAGVELEIWGYKAISHLEYVPIPIKRKRFEEYDKHLEIHDFKKAKMKRKEIAEKVYPEACKLARESGDWNLESLVEKVKRQYNEAKKLVNGGYKDIR